MYPTYKRALLQLDFPLYIQSIRVSIVCLPINMSTLNPQFWPFSAHLQSIGEQDNLEVETRLPFREQRPMLTT